MRPDLTRAGRSFGRAALALGLLLAVATAPRLAVAAAALRVAVISDLNGAYGSTHYEPSVARAVDHLVRAKPDLVIVTGDMVAGQRLHPPLQRPALVAMWTTFLEEVREPIDAAGIPLAVTPGNHDASGYERFALERTVFREQWQDRAQRLRFVDRADYPFRYAFEVGGVLFVSLDATRVGPLDPEQLRWLDGLLEREGGRFRHRVVFGHLPVFPFSQGRESEVLEGDELERLLKRRAVGLYLSGHHQAYYPGYRDGVRHVGQACLGAGPRKLIGSARGSPRAITWLEFGDEGVSVNALTEPSFERPLDPSTLPPSLRSRRGALTRDDLRPASGAPAPDPGAGR